MKKTTAKKKPAKRKPGLSMAELADSLISQIAKELRALDATSDV